MYLVFRVGMMNICMVTHFESEGSYSRVVASKSLAQEGGVNGVGVCGGAPLPVVMRAS